MDKSVLAMQISCYVYYQLKYKYNFNPCFNLKDNFVFTGSNLIKKGHFLGKNHPYSPLNFDEAGADLEGRKVVTGATRKVLDYFRECGQYNLFNILVIPEFFDLPRGIALSRSIFLLNVYYTANEKTGKFRRGYFNFYSRPNKKRLFLRGKKDLNYYAAPYDFHGRFYEFYPINEEEYKEMKRKALIDRDRSKKDIKTIQRDTGLNILRYKFKLKIMEIRDLFSNFGCKIGRDSIIDATKHNKDLYKQNP